MLIEESPLRVSDWRSSRGLDEGESTSLSTLLNNRFRIVVVLAMGALLTLLVRTAWQADDSYAAWRLVDHFIHGQGLRYNIDERVQTFTSMLWTFLVAGLSVVFRNIYYVSIFTSIALTLATAWLLVRPHRNQVAPIAFAFSALGCCCSFMDFSCGGFENPLNHFLLAVFALIYFKADFDDPKTMSVMFALCGLAGLTRLDALGYYLFPMILAVRSTSLKWRKLLKCSAWWWGPISAWHSFTLFYFGFPFQNAAYAKRFNNVRLSQYLRAGLDYFLNIMERDPLVLAVIGAGIVLAFNGSGKRAKHFAGGICLYLGYILFIGGDFMSGRFFTVAYVASLILILRSRVLEDRLVGVVAIGLVCLLSCMTPHPPYRNDKSFGRNREHTVTSEWEQRGIADERASWYQHSGLLLSSRLYDMPRPLPEWDFIERRSLHLAEQEKYGRVTMIMPTGYCGFFMPLDWHVYDRNGQVDPLMARIPIRPGRNWRIGHLMKNVPAGYEETLRTGVNKIEDPDLAVYYDKLRLISRGGLFSWERIKTIFAMNLGWYDHHMKAYSQRHPETGNY